MEVLWLLGREPQKTLYNYFWCVHVKRSSQPIEKRVTVPVGPLTLRPRPFRRAVGWKVWLFFKLTLAYWVG